MIETIYLNDSNKVVSKDKATKYEKIIYDKNNKMISREYGRFDKRKGYNANPESFTNR
jgi:hypothetical protein